MADNNQHFQWSFKPLVFSLRLVGIPFNVSDDRKPYRTVLILVPLFGFGIILANLLINGPRGFESGSLKWMNDIQNFNSSYTYLKINSFGIVKLVKIISNNIFFCYVPFLHLTFVLMLLFGRNWDELMFTLHKIEEKMKLNKEFYSKLHKRCIGALFLLIVV